MDVILKVWNLETLVSYFYYQMRLKKLGLFRFLTLKLNNSANAYPISTFFLINISTNNGDSKYCNSFTVWELADCCSFPMVCIGFCTPICLRVICFESWVQVFMPHLVCAFCLTWVSLAAGVQCLNNWALNTFSINLFVRTGAYYLNFTVP